MRHPLRFALALSVALTVVFYVIIGVVDSFFAEEPKAISFIEAETEYLSFRVANPEYAGLQISGLRTEGDDPDAPSSCFAGEPEFGLNDIVVYLAAAEGSFVLRVLSPAKPGTDPESGAIKYQIATDPSACPESAPPHRLPIWGPGNLGHLFRGSDDSLLLLEGRLSVFGRSLIKGALFPVFDEPVPLPAASVVSTLAPGDAEPQAALVGYAEYRHGQEGGAGARLAAHVTTEARSIDITAPGSPSDPKRLQIGTFTRVFDDPDVLNLQVYLLAFLFLLGTSMEFVSLAYHGREERRRYSESLPASEPADPAGPAR